MFIIQWILLGRMIHSMVAHLDAVTSLAIDPQQTCLLSGSKIIRFQDDGLSREYFV